MKIKLNIKHSIAAFLLGVLLLSAFSCTREEANTGIDIYTGEKVSLNISLGSTYNSRIDPDATITTVHSIVFNDKGQLVYNNVIVATFDTEQSEYVVKTEAAHGFNNFYFICNETTELAEKLKNIRSEAEIEKTTFSAVDITGAPPMFGKVVNAYISARSNGTDAKATINNVTYTEMPVEVTRMVARLSFTAIKNITNPDEDFTVTDLTIKVCRMPGETPVGAGRIYGGSSWTDSPIISGTGELDNNGTYTINGDNYTIPEDVDFITIPDTYIPEHLLSEPADASQATYLKVSAQCVLKNGSMQMVNCVYLLNIGQAPPQNHNLTRNNHYRVYATITGMGAMGLYAEIVAMEQHDITINWKPIDGLVIVSDKESDYDPATGTSKNVNIWNDNTVYSGILKAYHSETGYKDILFKYGSLIAIRNVPTASNGTEFVPPSGAEALNDVLWYPSSYNPLNITAWSDVPYLADSQIPAGNTDEQVKSGLGDPCKLAGLSETQIRDMGIIDNGQWHMATPEEYGHIMQATNNETSTYGYLAYHWLLLPHNQYRDTDGASQGGVSNGWYWDNAASVFEFSGDPVAASTQSDKDRRNGYMVRCVRNEIPESQMKIGTVNSVTYQGTGDGRNAFIGINSNVPYWTATFVGATAEADFDDFSFASGSVVHTTHGSNIQNIPVYVKRKESTTSRSFRVQVEGFGLDGVKRSLSAIISQSGYDLRGSTELSKLESIPQAGATYNLNLQITPTDIQVPAGKLFIQAMYGDQVIDTTDKVDTDPGTYSYPVSLTIKANEYPSAINITFNMCIERQGGGLYLLGAPSILQKGTLQRGTQ